MRPPDPWRETEHLRLVSSYCRCPTRKQNYSYVMYLLKVLYLESTVSGMYVNVRKEYVLCESVFA